MTACPSPLPRWWDDFTAWREHGGIPAERPKTVPKAVPAWAWPCYRSQHPVKPKPSTNPYANLGVYSRVGFFVNPTAGSPVGGAKEITEAAYGAGVTCCSMNVGDGGSWGDWPWKPGRFNHWARCDTVLRSASLAFFSKQHWVEPPAPIANIESPEIVAGFCTPEHAMALVGPEGAIITEGSAPHADWKPVGTQPVFLEIDPTVAKIRADLQRVGVKGLVEYAHTLGIQVPVPCFFIVPSDLWDGDQRTFATYWDRLREMWPAPLPFALYPAESVPDWSVIK